MTVKVIDSVTRLTADDRGSVVIAGSHCGTFAAGVAAVRGARGVVLHDAGVGIDDAGIAGLGLLDRFRIPGVTVGWNEAAIGRADSVASASATTYHNETAVELGIGRETSARRAAEMMERASLPDQVEVDLTEARYEAAIKGRRVLVLDSVSLVRQGDEGRLVVCGSHASILGADRRSACKIDVGAIAFNDAGRPDRATRLPALDDRGIAAVAVRHDSARIGDGAHTLDHGVISVINNSARATGAEIGMRILEWIAATTLEDDT